MQEYKNLKDFAKICSLFNDLQTEEVGVTKISKTLNMSLSKISRMLSTLESEGFFEKSEKTGKYRLGPLFFELGILYAYHSPLRKIIRPHVEQIANESKVTVTWGILRKNRIIIMDRIQNLPIDTLAYRIGLNIPIHSTAAGKILMSYLPEEEQDRILQSIHLEKNTDATVVDPKLIKENLKLFKERGYSTDEEETQEGLIAIAVPIRDSHGQVIASISLNDQKSQTSKETLFKKVDYLKEKALFISRQLGFRVF
jgi:DNA-binding IclR family transcriptional regulator